MAPKRKARSSAPPANMSPRKTRSATAGKRVGPPPAPPAKKVKSASNGNAKKPPGSKRNVAGTTMKDNVSDAEEPRVAPSPADAAVEGSAKTIIVEACKQCNSFKTRAIKVKEGLENSVSGIIVTVNPDKPRRGCFEIREENGQVFVSLLDMRRPFTPMKELDMDEVIEDIIKKIT
ncbi:selenoprotein H [Canna indica]|uniref:Selenoprotein H n=1 Tax=Canna indica TaxID=4628 RepID=A0AAQ3KUR5_9LILI|nr:selenoprotein H [Canna indica]